jgi:hypothetical protein
MNEHIPLSSEHLDLQYGLLKKKKKKCRGNRKLQRFKRKCWAQGMNSEAIEMLLSIKNENRSVNQYDQKLDKKEMNQSSITKSINNDVNIVSLLDNQV